MREKIKGGKKASKKGRKIEVTFFFFFLILLFIYIFLVSKLLYHKI